MARLTRAQRRHVERLAQSYEESYKPWRQAYGGDFAAFQAWKHGEAVWRHTYGGDFAAFQAWQHRHDPTWMPSPRPRSALWPSRRQP